MRTLHIVHVMQNPRPRALALVDAATGGEVGEVIARMSARRATYQGIADELNERFGISVSREMVRRWIAVDLASDEDPAA